MIYRALVDLDFGKRTAKKGDLFATANMKPETLEILEKMGKVAPANLPPVEAVPRLRSRKAALLKINVVNAGQFIQADEAALAKAMNTDEAEIRRIKAEMFAQFATPPPAKD